MNAQQLKNSILQEAIEGRLVPQDPNDEPASVLLERIRKEKKRLYKAGLLKKKEIIEREIYEDEVPFTLPDGWLWTKIDNVAFVTKLAGFEYTKYIADNLVPKENGIPLFKGKNVQNGKIVYEFEAYIPVELSNELKRSQINKKCLLTPYVGTIGNIGIHDKSGVYHLGSNVGKIEFYNGDNLNILEEYVKYYLMSSYGYDELTKYKKATAQESISIEAIRDVFLPLPPLAEQKRIVEKIEELLPKVEKYGKAQEALNKLDEELPEKLKKSILQEAIEGRLVPQDPNDEPASVLLDKIRAEKKRLVKEGKLKKKDLEETPISEDEIPFEIPKSWEWVRIGNVYKTSSGGTPEKGHPEYYGGDIHWVKVGDLTNIYIDQTDDKITEEGLNSSSAKIFPADTILLAMYCNDAIGKSSILTKPMSTNQAICGLYPNPFLQKEYIYYAIQSNRRKLQEQSAGGAQKNINQKIVNDLIFPLPPLAEQKRIVAKIEEVFKEIDKLKK